MSGHDSAPSVRAGQAAPAPFVKPQHVKGDRVKLSLFVLDSLWVLPLGCVVGFAWSNLAGESYFRFAHPLTFAVNNVGIVLFFALVAKEVVEAALPGGALHPWRRAALPAVAALGGVVATILVYMAVLDFVQEPMLRAEGWAVPCGIDIAMCYLVGGLIFGRHPAIPYLLLLAVASNALGMTLVAIFHPAADPQLLLGAVMMALAMGLAYGLRRLHIKSFWVYLVGPGSLAWFALYFGGVHPAMALVPIVPFMPHAKRDAGLFVEPAPGAHDTLSEFERWWEIPVQVVLLLFGLVNAGVPVHGLEEGIWAMPIAMIIGRPIGVFLAAEAGVRLGLRRTIHVGWRETIVIGCAASVGLTVALFFSIASLPLGPLLLQLRVGALLSVLGVATAFGSAWVLGVGRFERKAVR
jgi:NhaA family Na+:H+ antiporter